MLVIVNNKQNNCNVKKTKVIRCNSSDMIQQSRSPDEFCVGR